MYLHLILTDTFPKWHNTQSTNCRVETVA